MTGKAAIIGGGVVGAGWAARFLFHGWDVALYDPDPETERKVGEVMANAKAALPAVLDVALPEPGMLTFPATLSDAVQDAQWIQESVPERLDLKHRVFAEIQAAAPTDAIIASSTSGFMPKELQEKAIKPANIIVAHPYQPVYLLPIIELVTSDATPEETSERATSILTEIGMKVVPIRKQVPAHVGDRLLEAFWREALWLIKDDVATTQEIDDIMTYGLGLRWAQMGLFETYRIAGGEAGMANFIGQFGPALKWPWTKLMDVPDLDDDLIGKIAHQSDDQSGHMSIRELERVRDANIVAFMRALKDRQWGLGKHLSEHNKRLATRNKAPTGLTPNAKPYLLWQGQVLPSWIDYNGHMTEFRYLQVFADSSDALLADIGLTKDYLAKQLSYYTVETHIMHIDEAKLGEALWTECQILHADEKRLHVFHRLYAGEEGRLAASAEHMFLHVDQKQGKACPAEPEILDRMMPLAEAHADLPAPEKAGRYVGQR